MTLRRSRDGFLVSLTALLFSLLGEAAYGKPHYQISALSPQGEDASGAAINNFGQIAITTGLQVGAPFNRIFVLEAGLLTELDTLGGRTSGIADINNNGTMVGSSEASDGVRHAIVYGELLQDLGAIGGNPSVAGAINDVGMIAGDVLTRGRSRAVIFNGPNDVTELGTLGGTVSTVSDINNLGQVVGISLTGAAFVAGLADTPAQEAFLYENGHMVGLGSLGGHTSNAYGINDLAQVVGESSLPNGEMHAFLYGFTSGMQDLGIPGQQSFARDMNEHGTIIGGIEVFPGNWRAAIFGGLTGPTLLQDLIPADSGWLQLNSATDINDLGQIVGTGIFNGQNSAFLLNPIPEPLTRVLIVAGAILFCLKKKRGHSTPVRLDDCLL